VDEICRLQFSFPIALAVILSNFVRVVCMAVTLLGYKQHKALVTIGDAIASFLDEPDTETQKLSLASRRSIEAQWQNALLAEWIANNSYVAIRENIANTATFIEPQRYTGKRERWAMAPSGRRWAVTYTM
jgi:hypothetical protein